MPRIVGIDIPNNKRVIIALTYIRGIGCKSAKKILEAVGIDENKRARYLKEEEVSKIASEIERHYIIEGQLQRQLRQNIQRLKDIGCYRGLRHRRGLPVRGQKTQSNARTRKGPRKTVAGKKRVGKH
jgi:small subunit ribosomal protein S13